MVARRCAWTAGAISAEGRKREPDPPPSTSNLLPVVGGGAAGLGLLGTAVGGVLLVIADGANAEITAEPRPSLKAQRELVKQRDGLLYPGITAACGGALLAIVGGGAFFYAGMTE